MTIGFRFKCCRYALAVLLFGPLALTACNRNTAAEPRALTDREKQYAACSDQAIKGVGRAFGHYADWQSFVDTYPWCLSKDVSAKKSDLTLDGMTVRIDSPYQDLSDTAKRLGYAITVDGEDGVVGVTRKSNEKDAGPNDVIARTYYFRIRDGNIAGFIMCGEFDSGYYDDSDLVRALPALGKPTSARTYKDNFVVEWGNRASYLASGDPNLIRFSVGEAPKFFANRDDQWEQHVFYENVSTEDRLQDIEAAHRLTERTYCLTTEELTEIGKAGISEHWDTPKAPE